MKSYGMPDKLIRMVQLMYKYTECVVTDEEEESERFNVKTWVKQGCVVLNLVMRKTTKDKDTGIRWQSTKLEDLDFADNIVLLSPVQHLMRWKTTRLREQAARTGRVSSKKSKVMTIKWQKQRTNYCRWTKP